MEVALRPPAFEPEVVFAPPARYRIQGRQRLHRLRSLPFPTWAFPTGQSSVPSILLFVPYSWLDP